MACRHAPDRDVGQRLDPVLDHEPGDPEALLPRQVGRDDRLAGRERVRRRGVLLGGDLEPADHAGFPTDAGADEQGPAVRLALHDLGEVGVERPADEAAGLVQDLVEVVGAEGELAELREHGLLGQQLLVVGSSPARHDAETRGRIVGSWPGCRPLLPTCPMWASLGLHLGSTGPAVPLSARANRAHQSGRSSAARSNSANLSRSAFTAREATPPLPAGPACRAPR